MDNQRYYNDINNIDEINSNGAELKEFIRNKDIENNNNNSSRYWNHVNYNIDISHDFSYSLTLLILGIFFIVPFFFNIVYIKSINKHARRIAFASIILGSMYFLVFFILFACSWFTYAFGDVQ